MSRDEKDRPYEDEQGRPLNPDMTGDVLSDRWETDAADTDEQPAVMLSDTYHLPPEPGLPAERSETYHLPPEQDALADKDILLDQSALKAHSEGAVGGLDRGLDAGLDPAYDRGLDAGLDSAYDRGLDAGLDHGLDAGLDRSADLGLDAGLVGKDEALRKGAEDDDPGYLPLDKAYEQPIDDEPPRRGFLGSGWSGSDEPDSQQEVRRRTKKLLVAAAAVVVVGVGAGWVLTNSGSDDCSGAQCASAGQVSTPVTAPAETEEPAEEPIEATPEPDLSESVTPTPTVSRVRSTRTPGPRVSPTSRLGEPTTKPTSKGTRAPQTDGPKTDTAAEPQQTRTTEAAPKENAQPTEAPTTQAPVPTPTESKRGGLLDWLFG